MDVIARGVLRLLEAFLALCMLAMVIMVFGNVVLRYGFDSGIVVSEELSRFAFIWMTFVGAVVAMYEGGHLGVDTLLAKLNRTGKIVCLVLSEALILACCAMLFWGTWQQHEINATTTAQVSGLSMIWVFGMGYFTSVGITFLSLHKLWRLVSGRITDDELVMVSESEEPVAHAQPASPAQGGRA